jgi:hypothetical protein
MTKYTGNYRIIRRIRGVNPQEISCGTKEEMKLMMIELTDSDCVLEEEVFTTSSLKDESGNYVNSLPYWRKSN